MPSPIHVFATTETALLPGAAGEGLLPVDGNRDDRFNSHRHVQPDRRRALCRRRSTYSLRLRPLFYQGLLAKDYFLLMGIVMIGSILIVTFNLIADVLYAVADPRIRYD